MDVEEDGTTVRTGAVAVHVEALAAPSLPAEVDVAHLLDLAITGADREHEALPAQHRIVVVTQLGCHVGPVVLAQRLLQRRLHHRAGT